MVGGVESESCRVSMSDSRHVMVKVFARMLPCAKVLAMHGQMVNPELPCMSKILRSESEKFEIRVTKF